MADVFKVQDDIAAAVVVALKLKLSPAQVSAPHGTSNPDAYNEYLRGRELFNRDNTESIRLAIESFHKALALDPGDAVTYSRYGFLLATLGRMPESLASMTKSVELDPLSGDAWQNLSRTSIGAHDLPAARAANRRALEIAPESKQALEELAAKFSKEAAYQVAEGYAWRGEKDQAFEWLERAYKQRDMGLTLVKYDSYVDSLRSDLRFKALLRKMNLPE
jgi:tetratricopeptide (TPR) repeat protein